MPPAVPMFHLHVGLPKSGTTYLQALLDDHRDELERVGICVPNDGRLSHFMAALEMTELAPQWGRDPEAVRGKFARLVELGRESGKNVVVSHEVFGQATPAQVAAVADAVAGFELHVVVTARDFGRVIPAAWQEWVKNGRARSFEEYVQIKLSSDPARNPDSKVFWQVQNLIDVLERWGTVVPPERLHVVPCPQRDEGPEELWHRFADAIGAGAAEVNPLRRHRGNESLGAAQVAFLRRVNRALDGRLPEPHAGRLRKHWLAQELLATAPGEKARTPPEVLAEFAPIAQSWVDEIASRGFRVHGNLSDLLATPAQADAPHPDDVTEAELLQGVDHVVAEMLLRIRATEERAEVAERRLAALEAEEVERRQRSLRFPVPRWVRRLVDRLF